MIDVAVASAFTAILSFSAIIISLRANERMRVVEAERAQAALVDEREHQLEQRLKQYRQPLIHATQELQSRLFNVEEQNFFGAYLVGGTAREQQYAIRNTLFVIAQFFAWQEIIRREIQFLDSANSTASRSLSRRLNEIVRLWASDDTGDPLRIWAGEQRAIGERMIVGDGARARCIGYADFCDQYVAKALADIEVLEDDLLLLARSGPARYERHVRVHHGLIDLLNDLDPEYKYFPENRRKKMRS